ncbi:MAG: UvrD-helicase domain-containing protein [Coriobacteriia bacterium]|nr:UvrD-helicase domain-containing protein [Coriobacteriia bacterium]MCL2749866.1 UvrD-helicase domain-containing protein [Coriobacteriia bacterium]
MAIDLSSLNSQQYEAATTTEGPLLLLAGAGTGKTRALTYRIAHMVENLDVAPWQILAITFTNKAAAEMRERLADLLGTTRGMWILTFHALCVRILRNHGELLGFSPGFTIYDDDDSKRLVKEILTNLDVNTSTYPLNTLRGNISRAKNELINAEEYAASAKRPVEKVTARVYCELERRLLQADAVDFDDLLLHAWRILKDYAEVLEGYQERFLYISIDEYQDTNHAQYSIANLLAAKHQNIMVVGDDDQSIYSWRGADIRNILEFEKDYPGAKVLRLEQNYRSTSLILEAANNVIANNKDRKAKHLFTKGEQGERICLYLANNERDEGRWIAGEIERLHRSGHSYNDFALFYRTNAQSRTLEDMLLRAGVPYRIYGGTRFFDREEIRDIMAYLKLIVNPLDDIAAKRIINKPRRGIGSTTVTRIEQLAADEQCSFMDAAELALADEALPKAALRSVGEFVQLIKDLRLLMGDLRSIVEIVAEKSGLMDYLASLPYEEAITRKENVQEFFGVAAEFSQQHLEQGDGVGALEQGDGVGVPIPAELEHQPRPPVPEHQPRPPVPRPLVPETSASTALIAFMEWLALRSDLDTMVEGEDYIKLMTVHTAKGLEFKIVFIAGMEEGIFPHMMSITGGRGVEEERRLAYVAITRARQLLYLTSAQQRSLFGSFSANPLSRFTTEIPAQLQRRIGLGSQGIQGVGWEKRGSRGGVFGAGETKGDGSCVLVLSQDNTRTHEPSPSVSPNPVPPVPPVPNKDQTFEVNDAVEHKVFGRGTVISVDEGTIEVQFDKNNKTRKLLVEFAPLAKIKT